MRDLVTMPADASPRAIVGFFHGGGFVNGKPKKFKDMADVLAELGVGSISFSYRVQSRDGTTARDAIDDARGAAHKLKSAYPNVPILFSGSSAGGLLAIQAGLEVPANGVVLFNPVLDLSGEKLRKKGVTTGGEETLSPIHMTLNKLPPTLIFHGTEDNLTPIADSALLVERQRALGLKAELVRYEGAGHGLMNKIPLDQLASRMMAFIGEIG